MRWVRLLRLQLNRAVTGRMIPAASGIAFLHALSAVGFMQDTDADVWYVVYNSMSTGITFFTIYLLPALVFSASAVEEMDNHASFFWTIRTGIAEYTAAKILAAAIAGFMTVFLGFALYIGGLRLFLPAFIKSCSTSPYDMMMETGAVGKGLTLFTVDIALSGAVTSCFGMVCSFFIMSRYTAIAAPIMLYLTFSRVADALKLPEYLNAAFWMHQVETAPDAGTAVIQKVVVSLSVILVMGAAGIYRVYRRYQNG